MGSLKDGYEIVLDLIDRARGGLKRKKSDFSRDLKAMASLLDQSRERFEAGEIPRREGHELLVFINNSKILANLYRSEDPKIAELFDTKLKNVGELMRKVDIFYEEFPHYVLMGGPKVEPFQASIVEEACKEMQRVAGEMSALSRKYQQEGDI